MVELEIEKMIYGGDGLARDNGKSVFVPFVLPGERIEAELTQRKRSFARAEPRRIETSSPHRVQPGCPYFGSCGGCQYQHADYTAQLAIKQDVLLETLRRVGGIELDAPLQVLASPEPWRYRNRTRVHLAHRPFFRLGYYRSGSHALMEIEQCPISSPLLNQALAVVQRLGRSGAVPVAAAEMEIFADGNDETLLMEIYVSANRNTSELERFTRELRRDLPQCVGVHAFVSSGRLAVSRVFSSGDSHLDYRLGEHSFRVSAGSFFQINRWLVERFAEIVVGNDSGGRALDLYAGVGLFALPLLKTYDEVMAVEVAPASYGDLVHNLGAGDTFCETTEQFLSSRAKTIAHCDLAIVDPPRAGLGTITAGLLAKVHPRKITYVSCDPSTLARDLRVLLESGYRIGEAHLVDMFPQTFHIESVIRLRSGRHDS